MKRVYGMVIVPAVLVFGAAAQDDPLQMKVKLDKMAAEAKVMTIEGGVMGPAVKGAPYSADEIRESTQLLGDGTRIHNESKTTIYRDSEGRVRRESPNEISIWDPVSGTNYVLNPKNMTARRMSMNFVFSTSNTNGGGMTISTFRLVPNGEADLGSGLSGEIAQSAASLKKAAAELKAGTQTNAQPALAPASLDIPLRMAKRLENIKKESLGTQMMEGVNAEGTRNTSTIETGAIGNDRPIESTTERWYSQDLKTNIMTRRNDPRTGEEIVKLTNIQRGEQSPVLFELPPGYTVTNPK